MEAYSGEKLSFTTPETYTKGKLLNTEKQTSHMKGKLLSKEKRSRENVTQDLKVHFEDALSNVLRTQAHYFQTLQSFINNITVADSSLIKKPEKAMVLHLLITEVMSRAVFYDMLMAPMLRERTARFAMGIGKAIDESLTFVSLENIQKDLQRGSDAMSLLVVHVDYLQTSDTDQKIEEVLRYYNDFAVKWRYNFLSGYANFKAPSDSPEFKRDHFYETPELHNAINMFAKEIDEIMTRVRSHHSNPESAPALVTMAILPSKPDESKMDVEGSKMESDGSK